jgi:hypothetical protein
MRTYLCRVTCWTYVFHACFCMFLGASVLQKNVPVDSTFLCMFIYMHACIYVDDAFLDLSEFRNLCDYTYRNTFT